MKKLLFLLPVFCLFLAGCAATNKLTYEPIKIAPPPKSQPYVLPSDPCKGTAPPEAIFLKQQPDGTFQKVSPEQADVIGYVEKEHNKIVLRLSYYKELVPQLEKLVNIHIEIENRQIDLIINQDLLKELYRQLYIEVHNQGITDKQWGTLEKGGLWLIILGQLGVILGTI